MSPVAVPEVLAHWQIELAMEPGAGLRITGDWTRGSQANNCPISSHTSTPKRYTACWDDFELDIHPQNAHYQILHPIISIATHKKSIYSLNDVHHFPRFNVGSQARRAQPDLASSRRPLQGSRRLCRQSAEPSGRAAAMGRKLGGGWNSQKLPLDGEKDSRMGHWEVSYACLPRLAAQCTWQRAAKRRAGSELTAHVL